MLEDVVFRFSLVVSLLAGFFLLATLTREVNDLTKKVNDIEETIKRSVKKEKGEKT